jgi:hypothetical protein
VGDVVESEVSYRGTVDSGLPELLFDIVGDVGSLGIAASDWPWPEPSPGQTFWLSSTISDFVLRESHAGPVVLAGGAFSELQGAADAESVQRFSEWLGTALSIEPDCVYEPNRGNLSDPTASHLFHAHLGDPPGVSVASGTSARVSIGGIAYDVWLSKYGSSIPLSVQRAH